MLDFLLICFIIGAILLDMKKEQNKGDIIENGTLNLVFEKGIIASREY